MTMKATPTYDGRLEIRECFRAVSIVTGENRKLNVVLRDNGWEMNIEEPNQPEDAKVVWHTVNSDDDFKQRDNPPTNNIERLPASVRTKMQRLSSLRIGQEITRRSFDAGIPDEQVIICGIEMNPYTGKENIMVCTVDETGSPLVEDGLNLDDFR